MFDQIENGKLTVRQQARLARGKLRRLYLSHLRPCYIKKAHARRRGECMRCGACCKLFFLCPHLETGKGEAACNRHTARFASCVEFPIDERDLADRDIISRHTPCGYSFR